MAKRLNVTLDDGTDTWIELSAVITRRAEKYMWEDSMSPDEAVEAVLAETNVGFDFGEDDADDADDETED